MENKNSKSAELIEPSDSDNNGDCEVAHENPTCAGGILWVLMVK